jgi:acyl-coenzyme A thioesterase PaaI-like protein
MKIEINSSESFQDLGSVLHCFGCGADNSRGLKLKSHWDGGDAVATWYPESFHCGEDEGVTTGGIVASLIDCHCVNLAIAYCYRMEARPIGSEPRIFCVSAHMDISFRRPAPIDKPLTLRAKIAKIEGRKIWTTCRLSCEAAVCAEGEVLAIRLLK